MHINTFFKHAFAEKFVHNFRKYNFWFQIELLFPSMYSSFQYNAMHPVGNYLRTMHYATFTQRTVLRVRAYNGR